MPELYEATTLNPDHVMEDHSYGKGGVKILCVAKNGAVHSIKELEVSTRLTLNTQKDYLDGDNSDIVATDSQKNTVYVLAKKHGVKSCEEFAILLSKHFISTYSHVTKAVVSVEEVMWDRVSYDDKASHQRQHNHAFIHTPVCTRFATVSLTREDKHPDVVSGIKNMRVLKTTQSSFVNFIDDAYRTLPDAKDRIFSTIVDCSWTYKKNPSIDYDKSWEHVKYCILYNFAGDLDYGVYSPSVQNTLYLAEKQVLEEIADVNSIEMTLPNKHYVNIDFSKFKKLVNTEQEETVFLPLDKPSGVIYLKLGRKMNKL